MTERTIIAVVSDLVKTGLTVEQQALVSEFVYLCGREDGRSAEVARQRAAARERQSRHRHVMSRDKRKEPKENNILNISQGVSKGGASRDNEPLFENFWSVFPRKVAKGAARKAYRNALTRASHDEILAGAKRYAASKPDPKFTKHPASWLNADCWLDEDAKTVVQFRMPAKRTWAEIKAEQT